MTLILFSILFALTLLNSALAVQEALKGPYVPITRILLSVMGIVVLWMMVVLVK